MRNIPNQGKSELKISRYEFIDMHMYVLRFAILYLKITFAVKRSKTSEYENHQTKLTILEKLSQDVHQRNNAIRNYHNTRIISPIVNFFQSFSISSCGYREHRSKYG